MERSSDERLFAEVRACTLCAAHLPLGPRPVFQLSSSARILIAGQAPGTKVHETGIPFNDPSGERLRAWLDVPREVFYDPALFAILPMGFCYPGKGKGGDLPPRPECAPQWRKTLLSVAPGLRLTLAIGRYAIDWHMPAARGQPLTEVVRDWRARPPGLMVLPHPSPRNMNWFKTNPWFDADVLPELRRRVAAALG